MHNGGRFMYSKSLKYGLLAAALTGTVFWTGKQAFAADTEEKLAEPKTGSAMILNDGDSSGQVIDFLFRRQFS